MFEALTFPWRRFKAESRKWFQEGRQEAGKWERGVREDSSFRLIAPETAVEKPKVPILWEHGTSTISVEIEGLARRLNLDTGSTVSILQPGISKGDVSVTTMEPFGVTGNTLDIKRFKIPSRLNVYQYFKLNSFLHTDVQHVSWYLMV
jgi:hypothetical protein